MFVRHGVSVTCSDSSKLNGNVVSHFIVNSVGTGDSANFQEVIRMNENAIEIDATVSTGKTSPPIWFWVISVTFLLWYMMDMSMFFMRVFMTDEAINAMPANQQGMFRVPQWVNIVFAGEVFGGTLGCVGLLLRKKWALWLFVVSIVGALSQTFYVYFLSDAISVMGTMAVVMVKHGPSMRKHEKHAKTWAKNMGHPS